jgi:hypothetical protein
MNNVKPAASQRHHSYQAVAGAIMDGSLAPLDPANFAPSANRARNGFVGSALAIDESCPPERIEQTLSGAQRRGMRGGVQPS